jgi:hypothetical protein
MGLEEVMKHVIQLSIRNEIDQSINPSQAEFDRLIKLNTANISSNKIRDVRIEQNISSSIHTQQGSRIDQHGFEHHYLKGEK